MMFVALESGLLKVSAFSFPLKVVQSPELRYPFVEPLACEIPIEPVVVMVPPVKGAVAVTEVTLPFPVPVPNGPTVPPFILAKTPVVVDHKSPLTGAVGATPWGKVSPAVAIEEASEFSFPVSVPPARGR